MSIKCNCSIFNCHNVLISTPKAPSLMHRETLHHTLVYSQKLIFVKNSAYRYVSFYLSARMNYLMGLFFVSFPRSEIFERYRQKIC
jgi:hypothetical protein